MTEQTSEATGAGDAGRAREILSEILARMGMQADIELEEDDRRYVLEIKTADVERLVGRRGQVLDALQHVLGKMLYKGRNRDGRGKAIVVDAGGYRQKHVERLEGLAERMAQKAIRSNEIVALNPMPAHDRRIMHLALANMAGVTTRSEGEGDDRHMLIVPVAETASPDDGVVSDGE